MSGGYDPTRGLMESGFSKVAAAVDKMSVGISGLSDLMTRLADKLAPVKKKLEDAATAMDSFKKLKPMAKQVNSSKFSKGIKKFGGVVKDIMLGGVKTWALEKLMMLLQPFLNLLDLFNPIFEVMGGIIQEALLPVIKELIPYIMLAVQWLVENKAAIIQVINVLFPLLALFHLLKGNFDQLQFIIVPVTTSINGLTTGFKWLMDTAIVPLYEFIRDTFIGIWTTIFTTFSNIYNFINDSLNVALGVLFDWMYDIESIVDDANDVLEDFVGWIEDVIEAANKFNPFSDSSGDDGGSSSSSSSKCDDPFYYATHLFECTGESMVGHAAGGITTGEHIAKVGEGGKKEAIIPLETSNPFIDAIEEMAYQQRQATMLLGEIRDAQQKTSGPQRRMFG